MNLSHAMVSGGKFSDVPFMKSMPNGVSQWIKWSGAATFGCRGLHAMALCLFRKGHGAHLAGSRIGQKGSESIG